MTSRRLTIPVQVALWSVAAFVAIGGLAAILMVEHRGRASRWTPHLEGDPEIGSRLFFGEKGCGNCHSVAGAGAHLASDLATPRERRASMGAVIAELWNHAPAMAERTEGTGSVYPSIRREEMAHLLAFLFAARPLDAAGEPSKGAGLFVSKGCVRCHSVRGSGAKAAPDLALAGTSSEAWASSLWNHAAGPAAGTAARDWPALTGMEFAHLRAYAVPQVPARQQFSPGDPERGWQVLEATKCLTCHSLRGQGSRPAELTARDSLLSTGDLAALLWNHGPAISSAGEGRSVDWPRLAPKDITDLLAFLEGLLYQEPSGSTIIGRRLFAERGCARCHGPSAGGTENGPALRHGRETRTGVTLAAAMWAHGPDMYRLSRKQGVDWPTLQETDIGDLVSFLNAAER